MTFMQVGQRGDEAVLPAGRQRLARCPLLPHSLAGDGRGGREHGETVKEGGPARRALLFVVWYEGLIYPNGSDVWWSVGCKHTTHGTKLWRF